MVVNIKNVILNFIGTGIKDQYQADVYIFDCSNNLLYQRRTYNGKIFLCLKENMVYNIIAKSYNNVIKAVFYIKKNKNEYIFFFNRCFIKENDNSNLRTITFLLTDANYNNLPIEKGEMVLWPK